MIEKQLPIYDGRYTITETGVIKNTVTNHILKPYYNTNGYLAIGLKTDEHSKHKKFSVHRLVALAFLENKENFPVVLHKDNNKLNCNVNNLKWGTQKENAQQALADGLYDNIHSNKFRIDNDSSPVYVEKQGMKNICKYAHLSNKSMAYYYARCNRPIPEGPFQNWYIQKID